MILLAEFITLKGVLVKTNPIFARFDLKMMISLKNKPNSNPNKPNFGPKSPVAKPNKPKTKPKVEVISLDCIIDGYVTLDK